MNTLLCHIRVLFSPKHNPFKTWSWGLTNSPKINPWQRCRGGLLHLLCYSLISPQAGTANTSARDFCMYLIPEFIQRRSTHAAFCWVFFVGFVFILVALPQHLPAENLETPSENFRKLLPRQPRYNTRSAPTDHIRNSFILIPAPRT